MAFLAPKTEKKEYKLCPAGSHAARCVSIIDLGTHDEKQMDGSIKSLRKVRFSWELPNEKVVFNEEKGEQPFLVSRDYTLSMYEKSALYGVVKSWIGKEPQDDFDIETLLGQPCMVTIIHKEVGENTYANISSVSSLMKGLECPAQINPSVIFQIGIPYNADLVATFPQFIQDKITSSKEYLELSQQSASNKPVDDLPF